MNRKTSAATLSAGPGSVIICTECRTAQDLVIESVHVLDTAPDAWFKVEYSCGECESFCAHDVPAAALAKMRAAPRIAA